MIRKEQTLLRNIKTDKINLKQLSEMAEKEWEKREKLLEKIIEIESNYWDLRDRIKNRKQSIKINEKL